MEVRLTSRNQITIPANIAKQLNLKSGDIYDLSIDASNNDLKIIININPIQKSTEEQIVKSIESEPIKKSNNNKCYIKSNLKESETFSRRVISECGLLVRTKRSYLDKACSQCQGQLAKEYGAENHPCRYLKATLHKYNSISIDPIPVSKKDLKEVIDSIRSNSKKLDDKLNSKAQELLKPIKAVLDKPLKKTEPKKTNERNEDTTIERFVSNNYIKCKKCGEYFNQGFLIDNDFHCSECTRKDVLNYLKNRRNK